MNGELAQAIEREADNIPLTIGFKRLSENAVIPTKAHPSDSGWDLFASKDVVIAPGETVVIPTDIAVVLPEGCEAQVRPRSGITSRTKLRVNIGTIDNAYRGKIGIICDNITAVFVTKYPEHPTGLDGHWATDYLEQYPPETYLIRKGDKIAQLVVQQLPQTVAVEITDELDSTERGGRGFGSSGV